MRTWRDPESGVVMTATDEAGERFLTDLAVAWHRHAERVGEAGMSTTHYFDAVPAAGVTLPSRILGLLADYPGELDAADVARMLMPRAPLLEAPRNLADLYARRAARVAEESALTLKVSRALGKLTERGLVMARQAPMLAPWFAHDAGVRGVAVALARAHPRWPGEVAPMPGHVAMVREVGEKVPGSVRALLGESPSGSRKRVYADLCSWGVVVRPGCRWLTDAGRERVERERAVSDHGTS